MTGDDQKVVGEFRCKLEDDPGGIKKPKSKSLPGKAKKGGKMKQKIVIGAIALLMCSLAIMPAISVNAAVGPKYYNICIGEMSIEDGEAHATAHNIDLHGLHSGDQIHFYAKWEICDDYWLRNERWRFKVENFHLDDHYYSAEKDVWDHEGDSDVSNGELDVVTWTYNEEVSGGFTLHTMYYWDIWPFTPKFDNQKYAFGTIHLPVVR
jgi:hypothetical protein